MAVLEGTYCPLLMALSSMFLCLHAKVYLRTVLVWATTCDRTETHITFPVTLISVGVQQGLNVANKTDQSHECLTDMFVSTSVSEEKERSELPEQPSAPGDQEERSV